MSCLRVQIFFDSISPFHKKPLSATIGICIVTLVFLPFRTESENRPNMILPAHNSDISIPKHPVLCRALELRPRLIRQLSTNEKLIHSARYRFLRSRPASALAALPALRPAHVMAGIQRHTLSRCCYSVIGAIRHMKRANARMMIVFSNLRFK